MVLDHVSDGPSPLVGGAPVGHVEGLGHGDLHRCHVLGVPDRLEEAIGEAEIEQVLDRLLAEVVIDPEDPSLVENPVKGVVEPARSLQIPSERLLEDDPGPIRAVRRSEQPDDLTE